MANQGNAITLSVQARPRAVGDPSALSAMFIFLLIL
jgi:hypothetical protein